MKTKWRPQISLRIKSVNIFKTGIQKRYGFTIAAVIDYRKQNRLSYVGNGENRKYKCVCIWLYSKDLFDGKNVFL